MSPPAIPPASSWMNNLDPTAAAQAKALFDEDPRFRAHHTDAVGQALEALGDWLSSLFEQSGMAVFSRSVRALYLLALAALLGVWLWRAWRRTLGRRVRRFRSGMAAAPSSMHTTSLPTDVWLTEAQASLHRGDVRAALMAGRKLLLGDHHAHRHEQWQPAQPTSVDERTRLLGRSEILLFPRRPPASEDVNDWLNAVKQWYARGST
jgi:hypothetical protein